MALHCQEYDETGAGCHSTYNRGGADNSSFCANSACHGTDWKWAGLDAPGLREILPPQTDDIAPVLPNEESPDAGFVPKIPHPLTDERIGECLTCHGPDELKPFTPFHEEENFPMEACTECHQLAPNLLLDKVSQS